MCAVCRAARLAGRPKGGAPQRLCLVAPALRLVVFRGRRSRCGVELVFVVGGLRKELAGGKTLANRLDQSLNRACAPIVRISTLLRETDAARNG